MTSSNEWVSTSASYITPRAPKSGDAWAEEASRHKATGTQKLTGAGEVAAPEPIAEAFGIREGEPIIARHRVIYANGVPVEFASSYYPAEIAAGTPLAETRKIKGGAVTLLAELGHTAAHVSEDITARMPTDQERAELQLSDREPVVILNRLTLDSEGRPIQADVMVAPAKLRRFRYELKVD